MDDSSDSDAERQAGAETLKNARILMCDLSPEMQVKAVTISTDAFKTTKMDKDAASFIKNKIDADADFKQGGLGAWQVLVGRSFAACVTHETRYIMYFSLIQQRRTVLMFKSQ